MYAVIFKAEMREVDEAYLETANKMRELALNEYGCTEFIAATQDNIEIAISYWQTKEQIRAWQENPEHRQAQQLGKAKWYKSYRVQIVELVKEYQSSL